MRTRISILILFWVMCTGVFAQHALWVDTLHFEADTLVVRMPLTVSKNEVKGDYALSFTPVLVSADSDTLCLRSVVFRAKRNEKYVMRGRAFGAIAEATADEFGLSDTCWYEARVGRDEQPWLWDNAYVKLMIERVLTGCCETHSLPPIVLTQTVYREPAFVEEPVLAEEEPESVAESVPVPVSRAEALRQDNPILVPMSEYQPYDPSVPLRKRPGALYIHFPFDRSVVRTDFRNNAETMEKILMLTREIMADSLSEIKIVQIIGLASVEGNVEYNKNLSQRRADALKCAVQEELALPDALFECIGGGEAWTELRDQIEELDFDGRDELLEIIQTEGDLERREERIKELKGGVPFAYLKQNILRDQRNSGYIIIYYDNTPQ